LFFYDTGDLLAPMPEAQTGETLETFAGEHSHVLVQPLLVFPGLIIVAFFSQHAG